jgi:hypothetical protein
MDFVGMDGSSKGKAMGTLFVILMKDREAATSAVDKSKKDTQTITPIAASSAIRAGGAVDQIVTFGNTVQSALDSGEAQAMPIVNTVESVLHSVMSKLEMIVNIGDEIATVRVTDSLNTPMLTPIRDPPLRQYCLEGSDLSVQSARPHQMPCCILIGQLDFETAAGKRPKAPRVGQHYG